MKHLCSALAVLAILSACTTIQKQSGEQCSGRQTETCRKQVRNEKMPAVSRSNNLLKLDYDGFTVWVDCKERAAIKFRYTAQRDTGNAKRYDSFMLDPNVPKDCQQYTGAAYGHGYDRGHQVPANHLDFSDAAITRCSSFYIHL